MLRASELRVKEVVSVNDGKRLGYIFDLEIDMDTGKILSFVIPGGGRILGFLGRGGELVLDWENIRKVGRDVVLVDDSELAGADGYTPG
ncbi:MAG TPA: YlmC/YmxH family sporulation protein [Bacillota bacterium]|nr:YlmC/YmxH family sporulation protein [Bacillota bacterium]